MLIFFVYVITGYCVAKHTWKWFALTAETDVNWLRFFLVFTETPNVRFIFKLCILC